MSLPQIAVRVGPGISILINMFVSESSAAATLDAAHMPAFAAAYADVPIVSYSALREIVLMTVSYTHLTLPTTVIV